MNKEIKTMYKALNNKTIGIQEWWDFIETKDKNEIIEVIHFMDSVIGRLKSFINGFYYKNKVRNYCNYLGYSDIHPFEVVRVVSSSCVEIRQMDTIQTKFPKDFHVGGFSAHCSDMHAQEYNYISNENNNVIRIKKTKKGWGQGRYVMSNFPQKFYDYNF